MKIMKLKKNSKNTKFSYVMHYRALIFIEKLQFSDKITKILKNIKFPVEFHRFQCNQLLVENDRFSGKTAYRSLIFIEKL